MFVPLLVHDGCLSTDSRCTSSTVVARSIRGGLVTFFQIRDWLLLFSVFSVLLAVMATTTIHRAIIVAPTGVAPCLLHEVYRGAGTVLCEMLYLYRVWPFHKPYCNPRGTVIFPFAHETLFAECDSLARSGRVLKGQQTCGRRLEEVRCRPALWSLSCVSKFEQRCQFFFEFPLCRVLTTCS